MILHVPTCAKENLSVGTNKLYICIISILLPTNLACIYIIILMFHIMCFIEYLLVRPLAYAIIIIIRL